MNKFICKHPWSHFEINNPNGDVTMCCNNNTVLGNVNEGNVIDIWNGDKFQKVRKQMIKDGAHSMCPHTCPVLQGGKKYENLDWYKELSEDGEQRQNAELNETEFKNQEVKLESLPRWFRFTYSYACNLDCYHCYQREDATLRTKLPKSFMGEIPQYAKIAQMVYPFGGEPFYFGPVLEFLESHNSNLETRFFFITNGTLLTDRVYKILETVPISCMAVSLDAASEKTFINWKSPFLGHNIEGEYPVDKIIKELKENKMVGVANGRAEFGPRALGNRSLLADPRGPEIKDLVNAIKKRQKFRPFAPSVLEEHAHEIFDLPVKRASYMQFTAKCKFPDLYPAICHVDGTS